MTKSHTRITVELPTETLQANDHSTESDRSVGATDSRDVERHIDDLLASLAEPVNERSPLVDRIASFLSDLAATRLRSSFLTAWAFAALALAVVTQLDETTVNAQKSTSHAKVRCGIDAFFYGYPGKSTVDACRHAEAGRLALFIPVMVIVVAGLVLAAILVCRRSILRSPTLETAPRLFGHPVHALLVLTGLVATVIGLFTLRPASVFVEGGSSNIGVGSSVIGAVLVILAVLGMVVLNRRAENLVEIDQPERSERPSDSPDPETSSPS